MPERLPDPRFNVPIAGDRSKDRPDLDPVEALASELTGLEREERALTRAITKLYLLAHKRPDTRPAITEEDVALVREAKRDTGRARQIVEGLARRWDASGASSGGAS